MSTKPFFTMFENQPKKSFCCVKQNETFFGDFKHCDFEEAGAGATHLLVLLSSGYVRKLLQVCKKRGVQKTGEKNASQNQTKPKTGTG